MKTYIGGVNSIFGTETHACLIRSNLPTYCVINTSVLSHVSKHSHSDYATKFHV